MAELGFVDPVQIGVNFTIFPAATLAKGVRGVAPTSVDNTSS